MQTNNSFQKNPKQSSVDGSFDTGNQRISQRGGQGGKSAVGAFEGIVAREQAPHPKRHSVVNATEAAKPAAQPVQKMKAKPSADGGVASRQYPPKKSGGKKSGRRNNRRFPPVTTSRLEFRHNGISVPPVGEKRLLDAPEGGVLHVQRIGLPKRICLTFSELFENARRR